MAEQKTSGAQAIAQILKPLLDEMELRMKQHTTVEITTANLAIKELQTDLKLVTAAMAGAKKPIQRVGKEPTAGAGVAAPATVTQKTSTQVFPANKLVWFKKKYTTDEQYRASARAACSKQQIDKIDEEVKIKPEGDAKLSATATLVWAIVKENKAYYDEYIVKVHKAEKDIYDASLKAPSVVVEADSPPTGRIVAGDATATK